MLAPAAIYARVSTEEQSTEQQVTALRAAAERLGLAVGLVEEETGSGAKCDRPGLGRVMDAARAGRVGAVLVWKVDRLGRSVLDLARNVNELRRAGVRLIAVTQGIDLDPRRPDPASKMALDMLAAVAEYERSLIIERTRAGIDRARRKGTKSGKAIGRPRASPIMLHAAADRVRAGTPLRRAAREAGVGAATLSRFMRAHAR